MRACCIGTLGLCLLLSCQGRAEVPLLEGLSQNSIQSAFQILRRDYIRRDDLNFLELNRAALQGLLERLDFGADLVAASESKERPAPYVHQEFLATDIAYVRPDTFGEGEGELFAQALRIAVDRKAKHLVLDLRAGEQGLYDEAAKMLQCFIPAGEVMFKMKQLSGSDVELYVSKGEVIWPEDKTITLLIDSDTSQAAETLAAVLQKRRYALAVGQKTTGKTVRYTEVSLDDQTKLRYASAEMLLPDDTSLFKKGLNPTVPLEMNQILKREIFAESRKKSLKPFVLDWVRPRFNEAALVAGTNPELDVYVKRSQGKPIPGDEGQSRDLVIQRTLDLLEGADFLKKAKPVPNNTLQQPDKNPS